MVLGNKQGGSSLGNSVSSFKQYHGETLKDAWVRINRMHYEDPTPCEDEKLNLYFYYAWVPKCFRWGYRGKFCVVNTTLCSHDT